VNVSSKLYSWGKIEKDNLNSEKSYGQIQNYANSKLANVLFTKELARRLEGTRVTTYALHPGVIKTEITRHLATIVSILQYIGMIFSKSVKSGAQTTFYCALDPDLDNVTGKYYRYCFLSVGFPFYVKFVLFQRLL
jgi:NAD(P)-dependent dehydrogenase (short-subunit alcohol dehydrogenase family)